jgi:hypothetical protein
MADDGGPHTGLTSALVIGCFKLEALDDLKGLVIEGDQGERLPIAFAAIGESNT